MAESLWDLSARSLEGEGVDLSRYRGRVALVVNVASACGYTPQYEGLEALHREPEAAGLSVLGFPSNEFGGQEPGDAAAIRAFCDRRFGVSFPLFEKVVTRPGPDQSPVYAFLTREHEAPGWNFCKYLVGRDGQVRAFYPSQVAPKAEGTLRRALDEALAG